MTIFGGQITGNAVDKLLATQGSWYVLHCCRLQVVFGFPLRFLKLEAKNVVKLLASKKANGGQNTGSQAYIYIYMSGREKGQDSPFLNIMPTAKICFRRTVSLWNHNRNGDFNFVAFYLALCVTSNNLQRVLFSCLQKGWHTYFECFFCHEHLKATKRAPKRWLLRYFKTQAVNKSLICCSPYLGQKIFGGLFICHLDNIQHQRSCPKTSKTLETHKTSKTGCFGKVGATPENKEGFRKKPFFSLFAFEVNPLLTFCWCFLAVVMCVCVCVCARGLES